MKFFSSGWDYLEKVIFILNPLRIGLVNKKDKWKQYFLAYFELFLRVSKFCDNLFQAFLIRLFSKNIK